MNDPRNEIERLRGVLRRIAEFAEDLPADAAKVGVHPQVARILKTALGKVAQDARAGIEGGRPAPEDLWGAARARAAGCVIRGGGSVGMLCACLCHCTRAADCATCTAPNAHGAQPPDPLADGGIPVALGSDSAPNCQPEPCPPSSVTGAACLLPPGHPADSPTRFHRYPPSPARTLLSHLAPADARAITGED